MNVNNLETEYEMTEQEISHLLFHIDVLIFKIRKYQDNINILISEEKDYRTVVVDLVETVKTFEEISLQLLNLFDKSYYIGKEIGAPANLNYRILAKHLKNPSTYHPRSS